MKCPFRIREETIIRTLEKYNSTATTQETNKAEFEECLGKECMAYQKKHRTEMCQKFPMGYYKDILDY